MYLKSFDMNRYKKTTSWTWQSGCICIQICYGVVGKLSTYIEATGAFKIFNDDTLQCMYKLGACLYQ